MSFVTIAKRFFIANSLSLYNSFLAIILLVVSYLKNPFKCPWSIKPNLVPPAPLTNQIYGTHKYVKANNIKLHYVESGDSSKPLMLFVHGFPEFWYSWRHQIVHFNKDYRCVAVDLRGYGDSERIEGVSAYKLEIIIEDIRDFIRKLGAEKCILIGHDWGGAVACKLRDVYPDVFSAVIILASASIESLSHQIWTSSEQRKKSGYIFMFRVPVIPELVLQLDNLSFFNKSMLVEGKTGVDNTDIECFKYWFGKTLAFTPPLNYYRANFRYHWPDVFHEENVPFLAAHAAHDSYLSQSLLEVMKKSYAHIETTILEGCSHFMQQEEPEQVNKLIRDFLTKHNL